MGYGYIAFGLFVIVLVLLLKLAVLKSRVAVLERERGWEATARPGPTEWPEPSERVKDLARQGLLILAIKAYREETGAGLKEAKEAVERADLGPRLAMIPAPQPPGVLGLSEPVQQLARAGQKIQAIKAYREETGAGLAEAKDAVEAWMQVEGLE